MVSLGVRLVVAAGLVAMVAIGDLVAEPRAVGWMDERATWDCVMVVCDDDECRVTISERCGEPVIAGPATEDR